VARRPRWTRRRSRTPTGAKRTADGGWHRAGPRSRRVGAGSTRWTSAGRPGAPAGRAHRQDPTARPAPKYWPTRPQVAARRERPPRAGPGWPGGVPRWRAGVIDRRCPDRVTYAWARKARGRPGESATRGADAFGDFRRRFPTAGACALRVGGWVGPTTAFQYTPQEGADSRRSGPATCCSGGRSDITTWPSTSATEDGGGAVSGGAVRISRSVTATG